MAECVEKATYGGSFVTTDGRLMPFVLPGEWVEPEGETVLERAAGRVEPGCVHFGSCGGCQYQHGAYAEQLGWKKAILEGLLQGEGLTGLPEVSARAGEPWGYRNRMRLRVRSERAGFEAGYSRRGTNEFLPVRMCPIAAPVLWRAVEALLRLGAEDALSGRWLATLEEVEFFCSGDESRVQMQMFLRSADVARHGGFAEICGRLKQTLTELVGAGAMLAPELGRRVRRGWDGVSWGAEGLSYEVAGRSYWVSRGAFFQVNRFLVGELVRLVTADRSGGLAWDLYAGVGLFSKALSETFETVIAVEGGETAAAELVRAGVKAGFRGVRAPIVEFLRVAVLQRERPGLVVLDPPRAGLGEEGCGLISRIGAAEVVYVSCDPTTLARDLSVLVRGGYSVEQIDLVDLFPQTYHLETVVRLRRA